MTETKPGQDTNLAEKFEALKEPFSWWDLEWRVQRGGEGKRPWAIVVPYITNRAIMDRLDEVFGPENWRNEYKEAPGEKGTLCGISLRINDEWITKWDGAGDTHVEPIKGKLSDSMKRAAVQWGIGRYLYRLPAARAIFGAEEQCRFRGKLTKDGPMRFWNPPMIPDWALPEHQRTEAREEAKKKKAQDTAAEPTPKQEEKPKVSRDGAFLKAAGERKEVIGDLIYYSILDEFGRKHANEILDREEKDRFIKRLDEAVTTHEENLNIPEDDIPF